MDSVNDLLQAEYKLHNTGISLIFVKIFFILTNQRYLWKKPIAAANFLNPDDEKIKLHNPQILTGDSQSIIIFHFLVKLTVRSH